MNKLRMDKHRATWNWFLTNPQGGGFGSNHCGTKKHAWLTAVRNLPAGTSYSMIVNGKESACVRGEEKELL